MRALINSGNETNVIHPAYVTKLGLHTKKINVGTQEIDRSYLDTFGIVIADCSVKNKLGRVIFFQKDLLLATIGIDVVLGMLLLTISKANIRFVEWKLVWRTYIAAKALPISKNMKIINNKEFAAVALKADNKTFVLYVAALQEPTTMPIHPSYQFQVTIVTSKKTRIPTKYANFSNVFSLDSGAKLLEHTGINDHLINLLDNKQSHYGPIYSVGPVELETVKTYIKANLASGFIRLSKSHASAPIIFVRKRDSSLRLYIDYQELNNLTIKNHYLLALIGKLLDCLDRAKHFTQLDLTNAYHRIRIQEVDKWKTGF